jgi:hypothetical protein
VAALPIAKEPLVGTSDRCALFVVQVEHTRTKGNHGSSGYSDGAQASEPGRRSAQDQGVKRQAIGTPDRHGFAGHAGFVGIDLGREPVPDETTVCHFRHLVDAAHIP